MCLYEQAIGAGGNGSLSDRTDQLWIATGDSACLVRLLQGMCAIHHDGSAMLLHPGDIAIVDDEVLVAKSSTPFGEHDLVVACLPDLLYRELHGRSAEELPFFYIHHSAGLCSRKEQIGLPAKKGGYLQHIHIFRGRRRLIMGMDIRGCRQPVSFAHLF